AGGASGRDAVPGHYRCALYADLAALRLLLVRPEHLRFVALMAYSLARAVARLHHLGPAPHGLGTALAGRVAQGLMSRGSAPVSGPAALVPAGQAGRPGGAGLRRAAGGRCRPGSMR